MGGVHTNQELGLCRGDARWGLPGFWSDPCSRSREVKTKSVAKILPSGLSYHVPRLCGVVWGPPPQGGATCLQAPAVLPARCRSLGCCSSNRIPLLPCREFEDIETASFYLDMW